MACCMGARRRASHMPPRHITAGVGCMATKTHSHGAPRMTCGVTVTACVGSGREKHMSNEHEVSEARARCEAYAKRIEELWDADPAVRARIESGCDQLSTGQ